MSNEKSLGWATINFDWGTGDDAIKLGHKIIMGIVASFDFAEVRRPCCMTNEQFAERMNCDARTVQQLINTLVDRGYLNKRVVIVSMEKRIRYLTIALDREWNNVSEQEGENNE